MAAVDCSQDSDLHLTSPDSQEGISSLSLLGQNGYPLSFEEDAAADAHPLNGVDSQTYSGRTAAARTVRFASGQFFRCYSPVRRDSPLRSLYHDFSVPPGSPEGPRQGWAPSTAAIRRLWHQMPSTSDTSNSESQSVTIPTRTSGAVLRDGRGSSAQPGGAKEGPQNRSRCPPFVPRAGGGEMSLAQQFNARGGHLAESPPLNPLTSSSPPASAAIPSPSVATRPRTAPSSCVETPPPVGSSVWWAPSVDRMQPRTSETSIEQSSSLANRCPKAASVSTPPDRSPSSVGPAAVLHSGEGVSSSPAGDRLPPESSTVSGGASSRGDRRSLGSKPTLEQSYPSSHWQTGLSAHMSPEDLVARQAQLQRQMQVLQKRQRELISQQQQQLHRQQMRRPWLVPCALTPNATRLATLTIIPPRDTAEAKGNNSRCGSCPIFSRCVGGERSRSATARASRSRRIGVYVQPPVASPPPADTALADEVTCNWNCSAPVRGEGDAGWDSPGQETDNRRAPVDNRVLLKLEAVPPANDEPDRSSESQKEEETAPNKKAAPDEEGPDEVKEQLLKENTALREENAALKVLARGGILQAQLELLQSEETSRRYARIEASRRMQRDDFVGDAIVQGLEEENLKLRRQVADLGTALYKVSEDGDFQKATEALVGQLLDAHKELATLKKGLQHENYLASAAQTGVTGVLRMMDRGKEVFASDPNDISVQQAALDSLLSQGKRLTAKAREGVWTALSSMKDLIDQTFDRVTRLLSSPCSLEEKKKYLQDLHVLVVSSLDDTLRAYDELDATCTNFEKIRPVVFDPKRNSPYCPCRPRRQVLEDDLKHLTLQMKEAGERIRQLRCRVVKLEMENLFFYVQQEPDTASPKAAPSEKPAPASRTVVKEQNSPPVTKVTHSVAARCAKARRARSQKGSPPKRVTSPHRGERSVEARPSPPVEEKKKVERQTKLVLTRHREELLPEEKSSDEVSKLQFTSAIQKLQDEIDRLKDERQFDRTKNAERAQYLTHRIFACNRSLVDKLEEEDRLLERLVEAIEARDLHRDRDQPVSPRARADRRHLQEDIEESRALIRQSSAALREGQSLPSQTMERLVTRLLTLKPLKSSDSMTEEELELVRMINTQAAQLRKIHVDLNGLRDDFEP